MKNLKECCFWVLLKVNLSVFLLGCQQPIAMDNYPEKANYRLEYLSDNTPHNLTVEQLSSVFPNQLSGLKKTHIKLDQNTASATAFYGENQYEINIIDDLKNKYSNIQSFNRKYIKLDSTKTIKSVRDGYKTITVIQPEIGITSISFVFKKRYLISITGTNKQTPYMVWRFLELNKFQKLPK